MDDVAKDWKELETELVKFQKNHQEYVKKLDEVETMKKTYFQQFEKYKKKLVQVKKTIANSKNDDENTKSINAQVEENLNYMNQISDTFPRQNGLYLKIIIGSVKVSILDKEEKWKYKEEYEKFKFCLTVITQLFSLLLLIVSQYRVLDAILNFLLVWYYCTLTIRESILVINGSKIKGWWRMHHFISTACTAILLIWPESETYKMFRTQFIVFTCYLSFVQVLQYYYQRGCLYRLRALGEKEEMDTTSEGFQSWMSRGLGFLLPFLLTGYFFQLYNAYVLFNISRLPICQEWQVFVLSLIFLTLFIGNFVTTWIVIRNKFREKVRDVRLRYKYTPWKNLLMPSDKRK